MMWEQRKGSLGLAFGELLCGWWTRICIWGTMRAFQAFRSSEHWKTGKESFLEEEEE
jgi:hypothetical protein